jgi:hypothetical protein
MISINDTHHVEKPAPTYRIRDEAKNAAVAVLGPLAIHEFDFVTFQRDDGTWDWDVPAAERPLSAAVVKANGGKKFLQARAAAKASEPKKSLIALAAAIDGGQTIKPTEGTPMADPNRLPVPPRRTLGKAAGASEGPGVTEQPAGQKNEPAVPLPALVVAPACNGLDIKPMTSVESLTQTPAQNLAADLAIPAFLKREATPEAKEQAEKAMKRIAKQVGPDRTIKNPPDAKTKSQSVGPEAMAVIKRMGKAPASAKPTKAKTAAKAKKPASEAKTKTAGPSRGQSKTAMVGEMLLRFDGCTAAEVMAACNWPSVSMPQQAKACGLTLRKDKVSGEPTRYYGSRG